MKSSYNPNSPSTNMPHDVLKLPNCVYLSTNGQCSELYINKCRGLGCNFCASEKDINDSLKRWANRLLSLDDDQQLTIAKKYYGGRMPWNDINI